MPGVAGRSGRPSSDKTHIESDGKPESPRTLSGRTKELFDWLVSRLDANANGSVWRRIDGASLATLAELLADQESIAAELSKNPTNDKLLRLRVQIADRVYKFSGIVGLTPRDRERLPGPTDVEEETEWD